ncbi:hypothetical protein SAMN06893097_107244 [Geodermatophilus sabuli]|uniref:Integral membrane protein n=1 Tax=Geodermatophilus sabuli TaxID=1564158 RepID=A0A285EER1_9ACTN|nr:hypothetical protein SAMN06893097_107244 [Geodermatophilus sabuli]
MVFGPGQGGARVVSPTREDDIRVHRRSREVPPVNPVLVGAVTVVAAAVALAGLASTAARRRIGLLHLWGTAVLELLLLVQAVLAIALLVGGERLADTPTFLGYLGGIVLLPVAGGLWARSEPTRWAGTVLAVAAGAVGVMIWRLVQLWEATGG